MPPGLPSTPPSFGPAGSLADYEQRQLMAGIEQQAMSNVTNFQSAVGRVAQAHPEFDRNMLTDITNQYIQATENIKRDVQGLYARTPNGAPPDRQWINQQVQLLTREHTLAFQQRIHSQYGHAGAAALQAIGDEAQPRGPLSNLLDRMGTPGGIIGAVAMGALAFFGMGGMNGGILAIAGAVVGVLGGTMLGSSIGNWISGGNNRNNAPPLAPQTPAPGGSSPAVAPPLGAAPTQSVAPSLAPSTAPGNTLDDLVPGNLTPPPSPQPSGPATPTPGVGM